MWLCPVRAEPLHAPALPVFNAPVSAVQLIAAPGRKQTLSRQRRLD